MDDSELPARTSTLLISVSMIMLSLFVYLSSMARLDPNRGAHALTSVEASFPRSGKGAPGEYEGAPTLPPALEGVIAHGLAATYEPGAVKPVRDSAAANEDGTLVIALSADTLFMPGDDQLRAPYIDFLSTFGKFLQSGELAVEIVTVTVDPDGDPVSRLDLAMRRTASLLRFFSDAHIAPARLLAAGRSAPHSRPTVAGAAFAGSTVQFRIRRATSKEISENRIQRPLAEGAQ